MAKTRAPLLSFGARGQIGKTMVGSSWRGVNYMREYVVPSNPQTAPQMSVRSIFSYLNALWKVAPSGFREPWTANAVGQKYTDRNKLIKENLAALDGDTSLQDIIASPGSLGGLPAATVTAVTGGAPGEVDVTVTVPDPPTGWTLYDVSIIGIPNVDPHDGFVGPVAFASDDTGPYEVTLTGLPAGDSVLVSAYPVWTRPDGRLAYGPSINDTANAGA